MSSRLNIFYDVIIFLYENGKQEYIPTYFNEINKIDIDIKDIECMLKSYMLMD